MEIQVEVSDEGGEQQEYVGIEVCRGPSSVRMILTRPFRMAGQTVDLPLARVRSIAEVENGSLGEPVRTVEHKRGQPDPDVEPGRD